MLLLNEIPQQSKVNISRNYISILGSGRSRKFNHESESASRPLAFQYKTVVG